MREAMEARRRVLEQLEVVELCLVASTTESNEGKLYDPELFLKEGIIYKDIGWKENFKGMNEV